MDKYDRPLSIQISASDINRIATEVQKHYVSESGAGYPLWAVVRTVRSWLALRADNYTSELSELLTTPSQATAIEFESMLSRAFTEVAILERSEPADETEEESVFTGFRPFSSDRLGAMALYIAAKGKDVYKTKLNKLLFYSDFINFYLHGNSISGSRYVHVPFGPVPEHYGSALERLSQAGRVELLPAGHQSILVKPLSADSLEQELTDDEKASIDWVLETYGYLSAAEISELSHREKAYRFTRPGEKIAYRYAAFFETLPYKEQ